MSMISSSNQSFSLAQSNSRKAAALDLLNGISSPGKAPKAEKSQSRSSKYNMQTYRVNIMLPTALLIKEYDTRILAVRFALSIKRAHDDLVWQSTEDSQISQIDYIEQEIEEEVGKLIELMRTDEMREELIKECKNEIQNGTARFPEYEYKTAEELRAEEQERQINEQMEKEAKMLADVKPFNAANVKRKEIVVEMPSFEPEKFTKHEPKDYEGPYAAKDKKPSTIEQLNDNNNDYKPEICKKSEELAKKQKSLAIENPVEYEKQREEALKAKIEQQEQERLEAATHKPTITRLAEEIDFDIKDVFEREEKRRLEAEGRLKLMENAENEKEIAGLTFKPQILEYKGQRSRDDIETRYQKDSIFKQREEQEYLNEKKAREEEVLKECTFEPKINDNSKKLAEEYQETLREKQIKKELEDMEKSSPAKKTEQEASEFYDRLYQKGEDLLTYKKAYEEFAESTNVILASSVHTNPRSYEMAKKSYYRQCEKVFDELQQNGIVISRKIETYTKKMADLRLADKLRLLAEERDVWVRDEFLEFLLALDE